MPAFALAELVLDLATPPEGCWSDVVIWMPKWRHYICNLPVHLSEA